MLTPAWTQLRYHPQQSELWRTPARFVAVRAGRGSGKTELARRRVVRYLPVQKPWPDPIYFYALPTFAQAKRVAWRPLKQLIPPEWITKISETELTIETVFGSTLYVVGMDKPQRYEGVQWDGGVIDESSDQKPGVFKLSFLPALSHREAWCWRIGVPKRTGAGAKDFREAFSEWATPDDPTTAAFTWSSDTILPPNEIAWAKSHLDDRDYNEQYGGVDEELGGLIYHAFSSANVTDRAEYVPHAPIVVGSDFNVSPMAWVIGQVHGDELFIFDEIFLRNTNTQQTLDELHKRYGKHMAGWEFYGDAAGQSRHTSASRSDYIQIKNDGRFFDSRVYYPKANPRRVSRWSAVNRMFRAADGRRRCFINPRCHRLIHDLEMRARRPGSDEPDDHADIGHISDALGYIVHRLWPISLNVTAPSAGVVIMGV